MAGNSRKWRKMGDRGYVGVVLERAGGAVSNRTIEGRAPLCLFRRKARTTYWDVFRMHRWTLPLCLADMLAPS